MEEIEQLLAQLKQDEEVLHKKFQEKVLKLYESKQNKYKDETFASLMYLIESVFAIPNLFVVSRKDYNVAARSIFDYIINNEDTYTYSSIARETKRDRTTVMHSVENYEIFSKSPEYKGKYETIISLYAKNKSNTTN
jgi:chromosomal replication initiation ATPase DnaA